MRLLVVTQAVDLDDPVLGFFHGWLLELANRVEQVEVICLKAGRHEFPSNIRVHSLGKESGRKSRLAYTLSFLSLVWQLRKEYDRVFVHMNEEYLLIAGWYWKLRGTRTVLWRNHRMGSWRTRIALMLTSAVCYTSPEAFSARASCKAILMPVGIDTELFSPPNEARTNKDILFLGRLDAVKKVKEFVAALEVLSDISADFKAAIYGSPTHSDSPYAKEVTQQATPLVEKGFVSLHAGVSHEQAASLFKNHGIYVNLTPSGSFDKTILEAMASGCIVVCANEACRKILPESLITDGVPTATAASIQRALSFSSEETRALSERLRVFVVNNHSIPLLMDRLVSVLSI